MADEDEPAGTPFEDSIREEVFRKLGPIMIVVVAFLLLTRK